MTEVAQASTDDPIPADLGFGWDVDVSGEWAIVGAGADDDRPSDGTGMAFIFRRDHNGTLDDLSDDVWTRQQQLLPSDPQPANFFGNSVAIDGEFAVVGAWRADAMRGAVYVFQHNDQGTPDLSDDLWTESQKLSGGPGDAFGFAVAIEQYNMAVGAIGKDVGGNTDQGAIYMFGWSAASSTWVQNTYPEYLSYTGASNLGTHVAITLDAWNHHVIAASEWRPTAVFVYTRPELFTTLHRVFTPEDGVTSVYFGQSIALSGDVLVVGAPYHDQGGASTNNYGRAYVYRDSGSGYEFEEYLNLPPSGNDLGALFGVSAAVDGNTIVIGATGKDRTASSSGLAYAFVKPDGGSWTKYATLAPSVRDDAGVFGYDLAVDGPIAFIGSTRTPDNHAYVHSLSDRDGDEYYDLCDNCPDVRNGVSSICIAGNVTPCQIDADCDDLDPGTCRLTMGTCAAGLVDLPCGDDRDCDTNPGGAQDGVCALGICVTGDVTFCSADADCYMLRGGDGVCAELQGDNDDIPDYIGDVCDNCPDSFNPNQSDYNGNGFGDACDPAYSVGEELLPPDTPEFADADIAATANAMLTCAGGTRDGLPCLRDGDCTGDGVCRVVHPVTGGLGAFYHNKVYWNSGLGQWEGRFFANEPGTVEIDWKDSNGQPVGDPVVYVVSDSVASTPDGATYEVAGVQFFLDWVDRGNGAPVTIATEFDRTIRYNSTYSLNTPNGEPPVDPDVDVLPGANHVVVNNSVPGKIIFQYSDGGQLVGLEVVNILDFGDYPAIPVEVGRRLDVPMPMDTACKAVFVTNAQNGSGYTAAWKPPEDTVDVWPIRPEGVGSNLKIVWYEKSPMMPNCWHHSAKLYTSDWPVDLQRHVVDSADPPATALVDLRVGADDLHCAATLMYEVGFTQGIPPVTSVGGGRFSVTNPGYSVVRFDIKDDFPGATCAYIGDYEFEVVASYDHFAAQVYTGVNPWDIGAQIESIAHDPSTSEYPFGYLHAGQPYAPDIYAHPETGSGQIFPVNTSDVHGLLEVWWFQEGSYATGVYWPYNAAEYEAFWPASTDPIIIASRSGAGIYPDGAQIYKEGIYGGSETALGWNPNDEHALLLPIAGTTRAFAVRDDNPWNVSSGHPYVLVQYPERMCVVGGNPCINEGDCTTGACDPTGLWRMGVHEVIGEQNPFYFNYDAFPNQTNPAETVPVLAGQPVDPLFPVNFAAAPCLTDTVPQYPMTTVVGDALWVDKTGVLWAVEQTNDLTGQISIGTVYLWENWTSDNDIGCQPWRGFFGGGNGTFSWPIIYRPQWPQSPPECPYPDPSFPSCARPLHPGGVVNTSDFCGSIEVLHDSVGLRIMDPTYEVSVPYPVLPSEVDFKQLPPHLFGGELGGGGQCISGGGSRCPDRIHYDLGDLYFRGIMSDRDRELLYGLSTDGTYRGKIDQLYTLSRGQLMTPLPNPVEKWVSVADPNVTPALSHAHQQQGWITLALQNDHSCEGPVTVETWRVECPPEQGRIRALQPTCPFNEKLVLQHSVDGGGRPEFLVYQWQWSVDYDPNQPELAIWNDYSPPTEYADGWGLREVVISGASPFTLADSWWRVRYRGYGACMCNEGFNCNEDQDPGDPYDDWTLLDAQQRPHGERTQISDWTDPQLAEGWVKRVVRGLNPFDQRIEEFHTNEVATYVNMIQQAGIRYEAPVAMNCTPENINNRGLIEIYSTVLTRARQFSIEQGISYDPATLAILLVTSKISDLYMLIGNEAFADGSDPTIGLFAQAGEPPGSYDPHAVFCFENQVPSVLEEELTLLRGRSEVRPRDEDLDGRVVATVYNRFPWNFTSGNGQVAYANNYQVTEVAEAMELYPQGHGDAWGHYLTAAKSFYHLLRHSVFEWVVSTESVLVAGQPVQVGFQYERAFAKAAAAKARTGAALTSLTFRELFDADPTHQNGYPDPSDPDRAWGVADWARRAGQGAYFDWVTANALLDDEDDDPTHTNTIRQIDRSTVSELREIAISFSEIQSTLDKADAGLNPLGLAANVVPFGLNPSEIEQGQTHFEQIFERAIGSLLSAVTAFDYANDNTRRLRGQQDQVQQFSDLVDEREMDFKSRLVEIFGRPYPEDDTYLFGYDGPDVYHFDYTEPTELIGLHPSGTTTVTATFKERNVNPDTGQVTVLNKEVNFNVSTDGLGMVKPAGWSSRPEPGEIQFARGEVLQAIGRYVQALEAYEAHLDQIQAQADLLESLYALNSRMIEIMWGGVYGQQDLADLIIDARADQLRHRLKASDQVLVFNALAEALPITAGLAFDVTSIARSALRTIGAVLARSENEQADSAAVSELRLQMDMQLAAAEQQINIAEVQGAYQVQQQIAVLRQMVRALPSMRVEMHILTEAVNQATGRYHSALGRGLRLLEQRTAFRQKTARDVSQYRYRDMAFRIFRNDALQKYRAQFDLAARYAYLAVRAYDYETNLLPTSAASGQGLLTQIVKERALGTVDGGSPLVGNGIAGKLALVFNNWSAMEPQLGFNSIDEIDRTFSLRWELFRIPNSVSYDGQWRQVLSNYVLNDLNAIQEYNQYCQPLQPPIPDNPAIVIPFGTTVQSGLNLFGWPSMGDATLPSTRFAIKMHAYGIRFSNYPGFPLNQQVNVYLIPVGADVMRTPTCPLAPIREWHLLDQTLPIPFAIGEQDLDSVGWIPWDALDGGAAALVRRRLIPTVAACATGDPACTDISYKLTGRSVWNTRWLLIIPGSELEGADPVEGVDVFINGTSGTGVRDIKLVFNGYGYSGCLPVSKETPMTESIKEPPER